MGNSIWSYFGYRGEDGNINFQTEFFKISKENSFLQEKNNFLNDEVENLKKESDKCLNDSFESNETSSLVQINELIGLNNDFIQKIKLKLIDVKSKIKPFF